MKSVRDMVHVQLEKMHSDVVVPAYKYDSDSGMDVTAYIKSNDTPSSIRIPALGTALIPTGIKASIPDGYEIQVRSRSGLALKQGIVVKNSPGTLDASYRGEIGVILYNTNESTEVTVSHGDRIAQLVLCQVPKIEWNVVAGLDITGRGEGGFGSTGIK